MIGELIRDKRGEIKNEPSAYQPSEEVAELTKRIKEDYKIGYEINHRPYKEFNNRSLLKIIGDNQKAFNSFRPESSSDPNESWRWNGIRPITRNKLISIVAHITSNVIFPNIFAQNDNDERDQMAEEAIRDIMKWNIENSKYKEKFLFSVISAVVNPVSWINMEFVEKMQTIKQREMDGSITRKEVIDQLLSGIKTHIVPPEEMFIADAYTFDEQEQRFLIRRKFVDYTEVEATFKDHKNFKYVETGVRAFYSDETNTFYEQKDEENPTLCEITTYYNRREDLEVPFVNGIYMGDSKADANPMTHRRLVRTKEGELIDVPIYPYVKYGYEPIDEGHFFFFKSAAEKLSPEQDLIDKMYRLVMDGTFLSIFPPVGVSGDQEIDHNIIFPGQVTSLGETGTIQQMKLGQDLNAGYSALREIEKSMSESTQGNVQQGLTEGGSQTAFEVAQLQRNAKKMLGLFGKMITGAVENMGYLMIDLIINHQTVAQVLDTASDTNKMKYMSFLLPEESENGKKITKKIVFDEDLIGKQMTDKEKRDMEFDLLEEEGGLDADVRIIKANPAMFSKLVWLVRVDADVLMEKNEALDKAMKLQAYDRMIANPYIDQREVTRRFLVEPLAGSESGEIMKEMKGGVNVMDEMGQQLQQQGKQPGQTSQLVEQATGQNSLKNIL